MRIAPYKTEADKEGYFVVSYPSLLSDWERWKAELAAWDAAKLAGKNWRRCKREARKAGEVWKRANPVKRRA